MFEALAGLGPDRNRVRVVYTDATTSERASVTVEDAASVLEDDYLRVTRLARTVFERHFYGITDDFEPTTG